MKWQEVGKVIIKYKCRQKTKVVKRRIARFLYHYNLLVDTRQQHTAVGKIRPPFQADRYKNQPDY